MMTAQHLARVAQEVRDALMAEGWPAEAVVHPVVFQKLSMIMPIRPEGCLYYLGAKIWPNVQRGKTVELEVPEWCVQLEL